MRGGIGVRVTASLAIAAFGGLAIGAYQGRQAIDRSLSNYFGNTAVVENCQWLWQERTLDLQLATNLPFDGMLPGISADQVRLELSPSTWTSGGVHCGVVEVRGLVFTASSEAVERFGRNLQMPAPPLLTGKLQNHSRPIDWREKLQSDARKLAVGQPQWPHNPLRETVANENLRNRVVSMQSLRLSVPAEAAVEASANRDAVSPQLESLIAAAEAAAATRRQQTAEDFRREAARLDACQAEQAGRAVTQAIMWRYLWPTLQAWEFSHRVAKTRHLTLIQVPQRGRELPDIQRSTAFDYDVLRLKGELRQPAFTPVAFRASNGPANHALECVATSNSPLDDAMSFAGQLHHVGGKHVEFSGAFDGCGGSLSAASGSEQWTLPIEPDGGRSACLLLSIDTARMTLQGDENRIEFSCSLTMDRSELELYGTGPRQLPVAIERVHSHDTSAHVRGMIVEGKVEQLRWDLPFVHEWSTQLAANSRAVKLYERWLETSDAAYLARIEQSAGVAR